MIIAVQYSESGGKYELRYNVSRGYYVICDGYVIREFQDGSLIDPPIQAFENLVKYFELPF